MSESYFWALMIGIIAINYSLYQIGKAIEEILYRLTPPSQGDSEK